MRSRWVSTIIVFLLLTACATTERDVDGIDMADTEISEVLAEEGDHEPELNILYW